VEPIPFARDYRVESALSQNYTHIGANIYSHCIVLYSHLGAVESSHPHLFLESYFLKRVFFFHETVNTAIFARMSSYILGVYCFHM